MRWLSRRQCTLWVERRSRPAQFPFIRFPVMMGLMRRNGITEEIPIDQPFWLSGNLSGPGDCTPIL